MKLYKSFKMALIMVLHSKLRSWLTIIGIVIGVASVIAIIAIGEGMQSEISSQFSNTGGDILTITAGVSRAGFGRDEGAITSTASNSNAELTRTDYQTLRGISGLSVINREISGKVNVYYLGKNGTLSVTGVDQNVYKDIATTTIATGRTLTSSDSNVILIGGKLSSEYFGKTLGINQMLTIEGKSFRVVGILNDSSNSIIMPLNTAYNVIPNKGRNIYDLIQVKVTDEKTLNDTEATITDKLMMQRHVNAKNKDFTIKSNIAMAQRREQMLSTLTMFLTAIAGVSLLVGAVGVANTMFTSVLEKTKEIGIMKAIGGRNFDIMMIFLFSSGLIGLVGGLIGVAFGYGISKLLGMFGMSVLVNFSNVVVILSISVLIGMISGLIPAINASKLSPADALRSE